MQVLFKFIQDFEITVEVKETTTVKDAKEMARSNIDLEGEITLIYKGRILNDDEIICKLEGISDTFIIVHIKPERRREDPFHFLYNAFPFSSISHYQIENREEPDPPNFNELVANLAEMGFEKSECERALRIAQFNANNAASLLLSGNLTQIGRIQTLLNSPHSLSSPPTSSDEERLSVSSDEEMGTVDFSGDYGYDDEEEEDTLDINAFLDGGYDEEDMSDGYSPINHNGEEEDRHDADNHPRNEMHEISQHELDEIRLLMSRTRTDFYIAFHAYNESNRNFDAALQLLSH